MKSSADRKPPRRRLGFTLIETLVAISVAAVGLLTIFELFPAGFAASAKSQARVTATTIATDILSAYRREMTNGTGTTFTTLSKFTQSYTEGLGSSKYSNNYSIFGATGFAGDPNYYYKIWINEVIDPCEKYTSAIALTEVTNNRPLDNANYGLPDVVGLRRVTVFVRGPLPSASQANLATPQVKSWAEVKMVAYIANYKLGYAQTAFQCGGDGFTGVGATTFPAAGTAGSHIPAEPGGSGPTGYSAIPANRIYLAAATPPTGFTIFNAQNLSPFEFDDTGPSSTVSYTQRYSSGVLAGTVFRSGLNELGLDNIWIGQMQDFNYNFNPYATPPGDNSGASLTYQGESNKIINIQKDVISSAPYRDLYYIETLHGIRGMPDSSGSVQLGKKCYPPGTWLYGIIGVQP